MSRRDKEAVKQTGGLCAAEPASKMETEKQPHDVVT